MQASHAAVAKPKTRAELARYFRISSRSHHGLVFVTELAKAHARGERMSVRAIARRTHISEGYLEELAARLREDGIIRGSRGRGGGYVLSRPATEITMGEIVRLLDGPVVFAACQDPMAARRCPVKRRCASRRFFWRLKAVIDRELDATALAALV